MNTVKLFKVWPKPIILKKATFMLKQVPEV